MGFLMGELRSKCLLSPALSSDSVGEGGGSRSSATGSLSPRIGECSGRMSWGS